MKQLLFIALIFPALSCEAQELYSVTEPASTRPAGSIGVRFDHSIMNERNSSKINYHFIPEIMVGVSKKLTVHGSAFFSNRNSQFVGEGGSVYFKYRFLSIDDIQKHFRMAAFGRVSRNNSDIHQEEINMNGHNSGFETGIIATQLLRKVALSSSVSFLKAYDNGQDNKFLYGSENSKAANYSFSMGRLMRPKSYNSYKQININLMIEFITQLNLGSGKYYVDIAPAVQMIFNSQSRVDIGYKNELGGSMGRTAPNGFFIRLEHNFFNAF